MEVPLTALGRYEIVGLLASGGMAEVFLGRIRGPADFDRPVVLKRILPHLARQKQFVDMFLDEARIVARIRHPNVVQVHELVQEGKELFLVLEYLEGESLSSFARRSKLRAAETPPALAAHIVAQAAAGLHAAHELTNDDGEPLGLVHRDVSPQNLFLTFAGGVKVLDFGIAKALDQRSRTEAGQAKGKIEYMSPEQCRAEKLDRRSDVFALGIVLYEIVTGRRLFKRASTLGVLEAIIKEPLVPPSRVTDGVPPSLDRIVLRALARNREDRYQTAAELSRELILFSRQASPSAIFEEVLSEKMMELFEDRRLEKEDLLRRVRAGSSITELPQAEVDMSVELPTIPIEVGETELASRPKSSRAKWLAAIFAALALGGVAWFAIPKKAAPIAAASPPTATPSLVPSTAPEPATVHVAIESDPPSCDVYVNGEKKGASPLELTLAKSDGSLALEVTKPGFETFHDTFIPSTSQRLMLKLKPVAPRPRVRTTPATSKSADPLNTKW
jgi:serine/threonine-protein kinase